ncbi:lipase family alpha/beta hydrolase [Limnobacter parvus]|uniref:Alpha/beta hydrolase n=1 Tax=Limnobacter parvus TaxID=2939690 RepID=A0ABT1XDQ9_9BURK|nr:alpha/beta hydrolase [Limnobacter parvus]MCR2745421.1 alpha/beta hydrolase [Limnobacter parvus]
MAAQPLVSSHPKLGMAEVARLAAREGYLFGLSFVFRQRVAQSVPEFSPNFNNRQLPIVFMVPGYMEKPGCFATLYEELLWSGVRVALYQPRYVLASVYDMADDFGQYMDEVLAQSECEGANTYLVGHSMGGLIVRKAMAHRWNTNTQVQHLFTLASPNNGTRMAHFGVGECAVDMLPNSDFLNTLNVEDDAHRCKMSSVIAIPDALILHHRYAHLEGASNHVVDKTGHMALLDEPRLIELLKRRMQGNNPHQLLGA